MKTETINGLHLVYSEPNYKYECETAAVWAGSMAQIYFSGQGYLTSLTINLKVQKVELTVHFDKFTLPKMPTEIGYSERTLTSHQYWSEFRKVIERVRTATFIFKYDKKSWFWNF